LLAGNILPVFDKNIFNKNLMSRNWEDKVVVIAEDEQINFLFLKAVLKPTKSRIIWTKTGRETIDICQAETIDIILMDIKMPDLNGLEATVEIKKEFPNLPIIAQTAYAMEEDEEASVKAGCDDYISKPIRPENLLLIMSKFLD
jgi:CheY-like chemotaxis protein